MPHDGQTGITFDSHGFRLLGRLFLAQGDSPKPTALILHGLPGIEQNYDIALALRDHGWNAIIFHYRGCWGSQGVYHFPTLPDDVRACIDYLSSGDQPQVDAARLALIGHSMGGWAAVMAAAQDERPRAVVAIAPVIKPALLHFDETPEGYAPWLTGLTDETFSAAWRALAADPHGDASRFAARIAPRPLLVVHAEHDADVPFEHGKALFDSASEPRQMITHPEANHAFTWHRPWLRQQVLGWLDELAGNK